MLLLQRVRRQPLVVEEEADDDGREEENEEVTAAGSSHSAFAFRTHVSHVSPHLRGNGT